MSLFDWYEPRPALACPHCGRALEGWQGKDGPCLLLVWRQGEPHPVDQRIDDELRVARDLTGLRLPERFRLATGCCHPRFGVDAIGSAAGGVWSATRLAEPAEVEELYFHEPRERRDARAAWLGRAGR